MNGFKKVLNVGLMVLLVGLILIGYAGGVFSIGGNDVSEWPLLIDDESKLLTFNDSFVIDLSGYDYDFYYINVFVYESGEGEDTSETFIFGAHDSFNFFDILEFNDVYMLMYNSVDKSLEFISFYGYNLLFTYHIYGVSKWV